MKDYYSSKQYLQILDKYFRASNYLTVAQLYLKDNVLLNKPLEKSHIKERILGHWGTCAGQNFVYAHCNRIITKYDQDMILLSGPGHGGNFFVANTYLEGSFSEKYPEIGQNKEGMTHLCKMFSFARGLPSHVAPEVPGSINEGGELGYSLLHGYGAVFDNPNLIATVVVGDGEAETGPLATSWHSNKFINPKRDGAVLPILHLNGYKIANPTTLSRISQEELASLFYGYGYKPYYIEGDDPETMHKNMAEIMDSAIEDIHEIWYNARQKGDLSRPRWPMIILRSPKGWTGPKVVDGKRIENNYLAHQVPIAMNEPEHITLLENWLKSYNPQELFGEDYKLLPEIAEILPKGNHRIGSNPHANGGELLKEIITPKLADLEVKFDKPGDIKSQDMYVLGGYVKKLFELNRNNQNYRTFSPDEASSNRLYQQFEVEKRMFNGETYSSDDGVSVNGRVMDSYLSEHACEGWLEGYLLTGRHGMFNTYEAFGRVVDSMVSQHCKWLKTTQQIAWRKPISSLNIILTSDVWQQDHNGYTHQDPGMISHIAEKAPNTFRIYLPVDSNTLLACFDQGTKSKNLVNMFVASKHPTYQWQTLEEAKKQLEKGYAIWDWASSKGEPDVVIACAGHEATEESLAAVEYLWQYAPKLKIRFVNILNLMSISNHHPDGLTDEEFDSVFTTDKPIFFNFHGYAGLIKQLIFDRHNKNVHVVGYQEEGSITTSFDMSVRNNIDRCHFAMLVANHAPISQTAKTKLNKAMNDILDRHVEYIQQHNFDLPEIENWKWQGNK